MFVPFFSTAGDLVKMFAEFFGDLGTWLNRSIYDVLIDVSAGNTLIDTLTDILAVFGLELREVSFVSFMLGTGLLVVCAITLWKWLLGIVTGG